ncbi:MAG: hypothetical protein Q7U51_04800 [Methanoregula sp.]|nr:hypothetical protein [Methanoregula sp.]
MTGKNNRVSCTAGVSESIGFLLIFTIVIAGIGLVTLYGYPMLLKQQTSADEQIMEKNMIVLQNDVKSLAYKTVPYKETSLKIGGGALSLYNSSYTPASSAIKIYDQNNIVYENSFQSGDLLYSSDSAGTDISLQNGAVVKRQHSEPGSVMLAEPRWFYDSDTKTMVINFVNLTSTGMMAKTGVATVQMALGETRFQKTDTPPLAAPVYLEYTPNPLQDYSIAWDNYFQKTLGMTLLSGTPGNGAMLKYQLPLTTTLVIKQYEVIIRSL